MRGKKFIKLEVERVEYNIELERKVTIIKGNSATGKSTFVEAISAWLENGRKSGVKLVSDSSVFVLNKSNWRECLSKKGCILVADEGFDMILYKDFASAVNKSDNYFLFVSRSGRLKYLTYSIGSIIELSSSRVGNKTVTTAYSYYFDNLDIVNPSICITEDSNSGKEMFSLLLPSIKVVSSKGKDNVYSIVSKELEKGVSGICVIVDGSAFGSCMGKFDKILTKINIIAPESFEYLLLKTSRVYRYVSDEVNNTADYCEYTKDIISYERYYTKLLSDILKSRFRVVYKKNYLPGFFKNEDIYSELKNMLPQIDFD